MTEVQTVTETEALVVTSLKEGVLCVTLNRPERLNALTAPMERLYIETMLAAADNPEVRVIVVTGAGRAFCAGADLGLLGDMSAGAVRPTKLRRHLFTTTIAKPIIAAINGPCIGVGFAMAMMCDMRFAALGTKFGPGMAPLGLPAEYGTDWLLPRVLGLSRAFEVMSSGKLYDGQACLRLGLVNEVLPDAELLPYVLALATQMAATCSPRALAMIKTQLYGSFDITLADADRRGETMVSPSLQAADFLEAAAARKEKRAPVFPPLGVREEWWGGGS